MGFEPGIFRPLFRVRTKAPPVAGSWRRILWQLRAVPRGQSGRKALWARARARARSLYHHGTHPLTKSAERRASAAPSMQARLVSSALRVDAQMASCAAGCGCGGSKGVGVGNVEGHEVGQLELVLAREVRDEIHGRAR